MINKVKISFAWTRTIIDVFDYYKAQKSDFPLADSHRAERLFNEVICNNSNNNYMLPWIRFNTNCFWYHYLQHKPLDKYEDLRRYVVPFYYRLKTRIVYSSEKYGIFNVIPQFYIYHHGIGLIISLNIPDKNNFSLDDLKTLVDEFYNTDNYYFECLEIGRYENLNLKGLSNILLGYFEHKVFKIPASNIPPYNPFSIITLTQGEAENTASHERVDYVKHIFRSLGQSFKEIVPINREKDIYGNMMFSARRGRLLWCSNEQTRHKNSIDCYHNNILRLSMHIESLADLINQFLLEDKTDNIRLYSYVKNAQNELTKLYSAKKVGKNTTYCSANSVAQINHNGYHELLNELRELFGIDRKQEFLKLDELL